VGLGSHTGIEGADKMDTINLRKEAMDKKVADLAPDLINLRKEAVTQLERYKLDNHHANVALVLDISWSMRNQYKSGLMQVVAEKTLALATGFDDDGEVEVFFFGQYAYHVGSCNLTNYKDFLNNTLSKHSLESTTNYANVVDLLRRFYFEKYYQNMPQKNPHSHEKKGLLQKLLNWGLSDQDMAYRVRNTQFNPDNQRIQADRPTFVIFQTDGDAHDVDRARREFINSTYEPIFWFLLGLGQGPFYLLEEIDEGMHGALTDNASHTAIPTLDAICEDWLYDEICKEYKDYPNTARELGLLPNTSAPGLFS
jgi:hypothetical protein